MRVQVGDIKMFFDVEGAKLRPDGPKMRELPTLLLLHGGPGGDHSSFKPQYAALTDVAQVVYLDHRGQGRTDRSTPETWNLARWADDLKAFCDAMEVERPIVLGVSFGGFVAIAYATRYPDHPAKLVLCSTRAGRPEPAREAMVFERLGGKPAGSVSRTLGSRSLMPEIIDRVEVAPDLMTLSSTALLPSTWTTLVCGGLPSCTLATSRM